MRRAVGEDRGIHVRHLGTVFASALLGGALHIGAATAAESPAASKAALADGKSIYIASTRKDGTLGRPAAVWYVYDQGSIYVASRRTAWRVRRIKAGRPRVKMWVSKDRVDFGRTREPDGPSFMATGALVTDLGIVAAILDRFPQRYPATGTAELSWEDIEDVKRAGLKDGSHVLIKYTPAD